MSTATPIMTSSIAETLLAEFETQAPITRRFLERLPEDKLTWKPHDRSLSAGQLAYHLAFVPAAVVRLVQDNPVQARTSFDYPQPASRQEVLAKFDEGIAVVRETTAAVRRPGDERNLAPDGRRPGIHGRAASEVPARRHAQPLVSASRPIQRVSAVAEHSGACKLGTERGRTAAVHATQTSE